MKTTNKITSFTKLTTWQKRHQLVLLIYKINKTFPDSEKFGLTSQIKRCTVSITSNITEGFSRQPRKEKLQLYYTDKGSLIELQNQILIAKDVNYITPATFNKIAKQSIEVHKLINGLVKHLK